MTSAPRTESKKQMQLVQFACEAGEWQRMLDYFRTETVFFQQRLSQIVPHLEDFWIERAEQLQDQFIMLDKSLIFLHEEVRDIEQILQSGKHFSDAAFRSLDLRQDQMRKTMARELLQFFGLRSDLHHLLKSTFGADQHYRPS